MSKIPYGGQTSCGNPACCPDPSLVAKLNTQAQLLAALEAVARSLGKRLYATLTQDEIEALRLVTAALATAEETS